MERKFIVFYDLVSDDILFAYREYWDGHVTAGLKFTNEGRLELKRLEQGERTEPLFRLPADIAKLLGDSLKAAGFVTPDPKPLDDTPAIKAHLYDAQTVRDRLLTLFEQTV